MRSAPDSPMRTAALVRRIADPRPGINGVRARDMVSFLLIAERMSLSEAADICGVSRGQTSRLISEMVDEGVLARVRHGLYSLDPDYEKVLESQL